MAEIDAALYHDTRQNLMAAANGDPELQDLVFDQLQDMKETGYFNVSAKYPGKRYDEDDHFERNIL